MTFLANKSRIEKLTKLRVAYEFVQAQLHSEKSSEDVASLEEQVAEYKQLQEEGKARLAEISAKIAQLMKKKEKEISGDFADKEKQAQQLSTSFVKASTEYDHARETRAAEENAIKQLQTEAEKITATIEKKKEEHAQAQQHLADMEKKHHEAEELLRALQRGYTGVAADGSGEAQTAQDQLIEAKRQVTKHTTDLKALDLKRSHLEKDLTSRRKDLDKQSKDYQSLVKEKAVLEAQVHLLQDQLSKLGYSEGKEESLHATRKQEERAVRDVRERMDAARARIASTEFPHLSKDVHGTVCRLVKLEDPEKTSTALEVAAGARMYNVVVATEEVGKKLLNSGNLQRRYTFIPLNKIKAKTVGSDVVGRAKDKVGPENVTQARNLVQPHPGKTGADPQALLNAINYVWGNTLVCHDADAARKVSFDRDIKARSVTLQGDLFDPQGTLTGGSQPSHGSMLQRIAAYDSLAAQLSEHMATLAQVQSQLENLKSGAAAHADLAQQLDLARHELALIDQRISVTAHHQALQQVQELESQLAQVQQDIAQLQASGLTAQKRVDELEAQLKRSEKDKGGGGESKEQRVKKAKQQLERASKEWRGAQEGAVKIASEIEELQGERTSVQQQLATKKDQVASLTHVEETKRRAMEERKRDFESKNAECETIRANFVKRDSEITSATAERDAIAKDMTDAEIQAKKIQHKITTSHEAKRSAEKKVEHLIGAHRWIEHEKQFFGKANTDYDFNRVNIQDVNRTLKSLEDENSKLSKSINAKASNMLAKAEQEYSDLTEKRDTILKDKTKIEAAIRELDEKKNETLHKTHAKVSADFGSILSTLLPGTQAKLQPVEGKGILDGLEVKVAFGNVWKESLTELSGGQKSLLALSLILSLLLFNPAPMYILDEIDSALDLSHTSNIGRMLAKHFSQSQFIVVSLKEGMFNNANVLFRTRFEDGVSRIDRTENTKSRGAAGGGSSSSRSGGK
jgi:structural maintenance of chromosome 2